jgi:murein DD-endopeptidase MepM/ murein hydrolase activator NlpD
MRASLCSPPLCLAACALSLLSSACAQPAASAVTPGLDPTTFLATRVPEVLTENAATLTRAPTLPLTNTPTASLTHTPSATHAPSETPTPSDTPTPEPTPYPTLHLANFPAPPPAFGGDPHFYMRRPIGEGGNVFIASSYRYGSTSNHRFDTHHGVEFPNPAGIPIVAVAPGVVYHAGDDFTQAFGPRANFYGHLVVLQLAQPWFGHTVYALYGHMDQILVPAGQPVNAGDLLGTVGSTGIALGAHLHFEVRLDQPTSYWDTRNPELWVNPVNSGYGAVAVRVTNEINQYLPGMRVGFVCSDGAYRFLDTYWDNGVNPDDLYGENAAMTDVPAGFCQFETTINGRKVEATTSVAGGTVNFVWLHP